MKSFLQICIALILIVICGSIESMAKVKQQTKKYKNGYTYVGGWDKGAPYGEGILIYQDSTVLKGIWAGYGEPKGDCTITYKDGTKFVGEVYGGFYKKGNTDIRPIRGKFNYPNRDYAEGHFNSDGLLTDGTKYDAALGITFEIRHCFDYVGMGVDEYYRVQFNSKWGKFDGREISPNVFKGKFKGKYDLKGTFKINGSNTLIFVDASGYAERNGMFERGTWKQDKLTGKACDLYGRKYFANYVYLHKCGEYRDGTLVRTWYRSSIDKSSSEYYFSYQTPRPPEKFESFSNFKPISGNKYTGVICKSVPGFSNAGKCKYFYYDGDFKLSGDSLLCDGNGLFAYAENSYYFYGSWENNIPIKLSSKPGVSGKYVVGYSIERQNDGYQLETKTIFRSRSVYLPGDFITVFPLALNIIIEEQKACNEDASKEYLIRQEQQREKNRRNGTKVFHQCIFCQGTGYIQESMSTRPKKYRCPECGGTGGYWDY